MGYRCRLLMVSGSLRAGSTNTAVLRTAEAVAPAGTVATLFDGLADLPHFNPDDDRDPLHPAVVRLRSALGSADAVLLSTPEYAGALPGSFKNLLDWTVGGVDIEMAGKPVAWINASSTTGAVHAHGSLRTVLGFVDAHIVEAACTHIPVPHGGVGPDGTVTEPVLRAGIREVVEIMAAHVASARPDDTPPGPGGATL